MNKWVYGLSENVIKEASFMLKIELYTVTVVGLCLLMVFGCANKNQAFSADSTVSSAVASPSPSPSANCKPGMMESQPVQRKNLGCAVFESFSHTDKHPAYFQFVSEGEVSYKKSLDAIDAARLLQVQARVHSDSDNAVSDTSKRVHDESVDKSVNDKSVNDKTVNDKTVNDKTVSDKTVHDKGVNDIGSAVVEFEDDGAPQVVVASYNNGVYHYDIFSLSKHPKRVASFDSDTDLALLKVGRGVHLLKYVSQYHDQFGARGGAVDIILKWDGTTFILDPEAMCLPPPTKDEIESLTSQFKEQIAFQDAHGTDTELTDPAQLELAPDILDLYYQGRGRLAKRIYNQTWPRHKHGKKKYWQSVMKIASKDEYWSQVKAMNQ